jgi:hypothetical protein
MHADRNHCTVQNDAASSVAQPLNERAADCAADVAEHLANFGFPKKRRHFVSSARSTSVSRTGHEPRIQNLAPEEWQPRNACSMSMDKALREMEFPSRLAGASWTVE